MSESQIQFPNSIGNFQPASFREFRVFRATKLQSHSFTSFCDNPKLPFDDFTEFDNLPGNPRSRDSRTMEHLRSIMAE